MSVVISIMPPFIIQGETTSIKNDAIINDGSFEMSSKSSIISDDSSNQDGRFISKLQWFSPNGELPGTYNEYLNRHPLTPAQFSTPVCQMF